MNNDNNMNGTVLGNTDNNPVNPQPIPPVNNGMNTETLGSVNPAPAVPPVAPEPVSNPMPVPPANDLNANNLNQAVPNPVPSEAQPVPSIEPAPISAAEPLGETLDNNAQMAPNPSVGVNVPPIEPMNDNPNGLPPIPPVGPNPVMPNNSTSSTGFTNPNVIGITPPVSFEPEKEPKKKQNKLMFIIIILVVLAGVGFGTYYVLNYTNIFNKATARISITTKDLEVEIGKSLSTNISEYATISGTESTNCSLNTKEVDQNKVGVYTYTVTCGETSKTGKITIFDNSELVVNTNVVYKMKGETLEASEFAKEDSDLTFELVDAEAAQKLIDDNEFGLHEIDLKVTDSNNKSAEIKGKLYVLEHRLKGFYTCSANEQNVQDLGAKKQVSERFAIVDNNGNAYGNITYEIITYTFSDETAFNKLLEEYQENKKLKIEDNEFEDDIEFIEDEKQIIITSERDNTEVLEEYGAENMATYKTIGEYFKNTLKYTCTYANK